MPQPTGLTGLTTAQVQERRAQGQGNAVKHSTSRSYSDIALKNVFNPVNVVLYVIGAGLWLVGDARSAFATVMLVFFNAAVGIVQEVRAKRQLDAIALLARARIAVLRDGGEQQVDPGELVLGDLLVVRAGDQFPVDGTVVGDGKLEVDESALTGESDLIPKAAGDPVLSGSFVVTGASHVEATGVGETSFANKLTKDARQFKLEQTPLQREVNRLLRLLLLVVLFYALLALLALLILDLPVELWLNVLAVITGSVSAGLLTLITLNYSWGAVAIGRQGGLVQQINAIESLSNVTVLCTDKTGTLTTNRIAFHAVCPAPGTGEDALKSLLADFAASASTSNKTSDALAAALPGTKRAVADEVPFSSARKWSAVAFANGAASDPKGAHVLGALEMLQPALEVGENLRAQARDWSNAGLRVLVFGSNPGVTALHDAAGEPILPPLTCLGLVSFSDELRPNLKETIDAFTSNGVRLKVISGDNPDTVAALAKQAGLPGDLKAVSGPDLAQMTPGEFAQAAADATVFGRISPQQKEALVAALQARGEYVAMTGDGVNDVLSLKRANMGIAMESGSSATRSVAAMILMNDDFAAMPAAFHEGQRIAASITNILKIFMVTVFALLLLIIGVNALDLGFPFTTLQSTLLSFFARGAPPLVLAFTATALLKRPTLNQVLARFTVPAAILMFAFGLLIYIGIYFGAQQRFLDITITPAALAELTRYTGIRYDTLTQAEFTRTATVLTAQTGLTIFFVFAGLALMLFAEPPTRWLAVASPYSGKRLPTIAAGTLLAAFLVIYAVPAFRYFFQLAPLSGRVVAFIGLVTLAWAAVQWLVWKTRVFERFLDMPITD